MGFRFHRSLRIAPGVRLNVSKSGFSLSFGSSPLTINFGRGRERITGSLPGSGLSYSEALTPSRGRRQERWWPWRWLRSMFG